MRSFVVGLGVALETQAEDEAQALEQARDALATLNSAGVSLVATSEPTVVDGPHRGRTIMSVTEVPMSDHVQFLTQLLIIATQRLGGSFKVTDADLAALDEAGTQLSVEGDAEKHPDELVVTAGIFTEQEGGTVTARPVALVHDEAAELEGESQHDGDGGFDDPEDEEDDEDDDLDDDDGFDEDDDLDDEDDDDYGPEVDDYDDDDDEDDEDLDTEDDDGDEE